MRRAMVKWCGCPAMDRLAGSSIANNKYRSIEGSMVCARETNKTAAMAQQKNHNVRNA